MSKIVNSAHCSLLIGHWFFTMRHLKKNRKFSRERGARRSFLRILTAQLIARGRLTTSIARAKEIRPRVERLISVARTGTLASRRRILAELPKDAARRLMDTVAPRFRERAGGYTRIIRLGRRPSDASERAIIEFVE